MYENDVDPTRHFDMGRKKQNCLHAASETQFFYTDGKKRTIQSLKTLNCRAEQPENKRRNLNAWNNSRSQNVSEGNKETN